MGWSIMTKYISKFLNKIQFPKFFFFFWSILYTAGILWTEMLFHEMSRKGFRRDVTFSRELLLACRDSTDRHRGDFLTSLSLLRLSEGQKL